MRPLFVPRRHETLMTSPARPAGTGLRRGALARRPLLVLHKRRLAGWRQRWVRPGCTADELTLKKGRGGLKRRQEVWRPARERLLIGSYVL